jgi:transcriptional regulator with PAS, ATPase and Fis domain
MAGRNGARGIQTRGGLPLQRVAREAQIAEIERALREGLGSITKAAALLGLSRQGLYDACKRADFPLAEAARRISAANAA